MIVLASYLQDGTKLTPFKEVDRPPTDPHYISGSLVFQIGSVELLDATIVDYIDQLWSYFVDIATALNTGSDAETYFPDQPIHLRFRNDASFRQVQVSVNIGGRQISASTSRKELVTAICREGRLFFLRLKELVPSNRGAYDLALTKITAILE